MLFTFIKWLYSFFIKKEDSPITMALKFRQECDLKAIQARVDAIYHSKMAEYYEEASKVIDIG